MNFPMKTRELPCLPHFIAGAFAVSVHAEPRATGDLDIWIEATSENAVKAYAALTSFGAPLQNLDVSELSNPGIVFQMGLPPKDLADVEMLKRTPS